MLGKGGVKPALMFRPIALPSLTPLVEGCQQPRGRDPRFGAKLRGAPDRPLRRMVALAGSAITSPCGHYRRFLPLMRHHVSTFLHPLAPPALPGFIATMSAVTPAWRRDSEARSAPRGGRYLKILPPLAPRRSPRFTCSIPPEPSVSNHPAAPHNRFVT